ncbi:CDP-glycerol glycerophosphotransferase family protein [Anaeromicropila herbilytica]|uniref:Uncharacterized protein n=1 Tax=Anaeromicropila herbilytica TaxID=2785025 RepID=A0A7R7EJ46_9FIRM|nr:CDP-glycerol glycerophosphotransferase family protein [Anaeromicropila herbilytica]BCN29786.1 hypothetical protein bsdtb5_10810 [Anaeromicropila herbilytica]
MFKPIINIQEFVLEQNKLKLSIKLTCDTDIQVRSPKIRVVFENGKEDRRLPMIIEANYYTNDMESNIIYAKYHFNLKKVFNDWDPNENVSIYFALAYGNNYVEKIPFSFSRDVVLENEFYLIDANEEKGKIHFERISPEDDLSEENPVKEKIKLFISSIYSFLLYLVGILVLPLFVLDAILSRMGMSSKSSANKFTGVKWYLSHIRWRYSSFCKKNIGLKDMKLNYLRRRYNHYIHHPVVSNRIAFLSSRRNDITGNLGFVYDQIKDNKELDIQFLLDPSNLKEMSFRNLKKLAYLSATSKVILVDDFYPILNSYDLREETKLIQLWHACGAFKTFGFSRLGKKGGPTQTSKNHRNYDYAVVSSKEIAKYYAEGFGIPSRNVVATGVPRTDIFFNAEYKEKVEKEFYSQYPKLKDKKIILFAPTFRGNGKESAFYPNNRFDPMQVFEETKGEYAIIIKHHPFVKNRYEIPSSCADYIIDMSEQSELNDLLFVTDLVITDYSSLIFEASLLNIPMLFYAYDLRQYISTRDFYYEYEIFVPGKIVSSQAKIVDAILKKDFEEHKIDSFKKQFFDQLDGRSTERVTELIYDIIDNKA